jgi:hypothetical protein
MNQLMDLNRVLPAGHQWFDGVILSQETVLTDLRARLGRRNNLGVFCRAYARYHNRHSTGRSLARKRMRDDYRDYQAGGNLPIYVLSCFLSSKAD